MIKILLSSNNVQKFTFTKDFFLYKPRHLKLVETEELRKNRFSIFRNVEHVTFNNLAGFSNTAVYTLIHRQ